MFDAFQHKTKFANPFFFIADRLTSTTFYAIVIEQIFIFCLDSVLSMPTHVLNIY